jgi:hypothetical protein
MLITIDTNDNTVEVLNEETKDWDTAWIKSMQYSCAMDEVITLDVELILPYPPKL